MLEKYVETRRGKRRKSNKLLPLPLFFLYFSVLFINVYFSILSNTQQFPFDSDSHFGLNGDVMSSSPSSENAEKRIVCTLKNKEVYSHSLIDGPHLCMWTALDGRSIMMKNKPQRLHKNKPPCEKRIISILWFLFFFVVHLSVFLFCRSSSALRYWIWRNNDKSRLHSAGYISYYILHIYILFEFLNHNNIISVLIYIDICAAGPQTVCSPLLRSICAYTHPLFEFTNVCEFEGFCLQTRRQRRQLGV